MKKVGIVADNYKLDKFKKELTAKGFTDFNLFPLTNDTTAITIYVPADKVNDINKVCQLVELHFKRSN